MAQGYSPYDFSGYGYGTGAVAAPNMAGGASNIMGAAFQDASSAPAIAATGANPLSGIGFNAPTAKLALGGLQTIGNIWQAYEANKLAKEQFAFTKDITNTNLKNQIQSYNTTLEDRGRARAFTEGQSAEVAQSYIDKNRLSR